MAAHNKTRAGQMTGKPRKPLVAERRRTQTKPKAMPKQAKPQKARKKPTRKPAAARKHNVLVRIILWIFNKITRLIWAVMWRGTLVFSLILAAGILYFASIIPDLNELVDGRARGSVTLMDRNDAVFAWRGDQYGGLVTAETVSPNLKNAIVATEDKRFYRHFGISPRGIASAVRINLREGRGPLSGHGGSTLTQQTAKLLCLGVPFDPTQWKSEAAYEADCRQGSLWRKVKEAVYAMGLEVKFTKNEILTIYINRAFLGAGARGFEAASQRYFGKSAAEVTPAQGAMLAGLLVAPTRYAPTSNLARSQNRANVIIGLMEAQGYITQAQANAARQNPAQLSEAAEARAGGYFADWVMQSGPEYFTKNTTEDVIIKTTLDQDIQRAAERGLQKVFETKVSPESKAQAAIVVMSADGAVRAMVGGRKTKVSGAFNRATQALRQTGSAFKPIVYGTALELGYSPFDLIDDTPLTLDIPGSGPWTPKNYTGKFAGTVTLSDALKDSLNIPAVRISERVGRENVRKIASDFGISTDLAMGPAIALGASESTLIEMVGAYAGILNGGSSVTPYGLVELSLLGEDTPLIGTNGGIGERVIQERAARDLVYMMEKVVSAGSGQRARLDGWQVAGKTGTTQAARDAWFIGFTADYVAGVWMGYDDNTPLRGVTGGGLPAEIWREVMAPIHAGLPPLSLPMSNPTPPTAAQPNQIENAPKPERSINDILKQIFGGN